MMKKSITTFYGILFFFIIFLFSCNIQRDPVRSLLEFGNQYQESGVDSDHSFMSIQVKDDNENVDVEIKGWGIKEYGLFLHAKPKSNTLYFNIMGICGTVTSETWTKTTFKYTIPDSLENSVTMLKYFKGADTLFISKK